MSILEEIAAYARTRVETDQAALPLGALKERCRALGPGVRAFENALRGPGMSLICEVKKASPSKGVISPEFPYLDIARDYRAAGADALSCLTEPRWFLGSDRIFEEIRGAVSTP
ncbi:MAG TPA: indole-3-glycerol-phosphate synthase TrpC, partial [Pseudoflavonifractor sp.]|nr:indole-3-glycerol-phosphate synthase TrpC [Pseudoflavonifractor sp.]